MKNSVVTILTAFVLCLIWFPSFCQTPYITTSDNMSLGGFGFFDKNSPLFFSLNVGEANNVKSLWINLEETKDGGIVNRAIHTIKEDGWQCNGSTDKYRFTESWAITGSLGTLIKSSLMMKDCQGNSFNVANDHNVVTYHQAVEFPNLDAPVDPAVFKQDKDFVIGAFTLNTGNNTTSLTGLTLLNQSSTLSNLDLPSELMKLYIEPNTKEYKYNGDEEFVGYLKSEKINRDYRFQLVGINRPIPVGVNVYIVVNGLKLKNINSEFSFSLAIADNGLTLKNDELSIGESKVKVASRSISNLKPISLPLDLISFTATEDKYGIYLNWVTANEDKVVDFEIQSCFDNLNWESLGFVNAKNNGELNNVYGFSDYRNRVGINYFRLVQKESNGNLVYSKVLAVNRENYSRVNIYPNPVINALRIVDQYGNFIKERIVIIDVLGNVKFDQTLSSDETIDVSEYTTGVYFVKLNNTTLQFVKP